MVIWLKKLRFAGGFSLLAACMFLAAPLLQQTASSELDIAGVLPPGAMIYLESRDFAGRLRDWADSSVKQRWLESENFSQFEKSRLYLRLKDRLQEFNTLAGLVVDLPLVRSLAGKQAGLGLYDIRNLEFVFVTRIPGSQFEQGPFFRQRPQYEQKSAEGGPYFARSGQGAAIAFGIRQGYFFLATSESLLRTALHNAAMASARERLSAEPLFQESQAALPRSADLWMFLNMGLVQSSRYFRNEWLYQNFDETARYRAGVVRLSLQPDRYREERQFLLKDNAVLPGLMEEALMRSIPREAEFVQGGIAGPREIASTIYRTLLNPLRRRDETLSLTRGDLPYEVAPLLKSDNRYFLQIDEPVAPSGNPEETRRREQEELIDQLEKEIEALGATALLRCEAPQLNRQGYFQPQRALVLNVAGKDLSSLKRTLQRQYNRLYLGGNPATWTKGQGTSEVLGTFGQISAASRGSLWVLSNSESFLRRLLSSEWSPPAGLARPVHRYAALDFKRFRTGYYALFQWLDYQARPRHPGEPAPYFSENLGSLLAALSPLEGLTVQAWSQGRIFHEEVVYDLSGR